MNILQKIICTGVLLLLMIGTGIWLSNSSKPLNTMIFNIHKLIALTFVIFTAIFIYNLLKNVEIKTVIITLIVFLVLFVLILFISGALLSLGKSPYILLKTIHSITSILIVITSIATIYLLIRKKQ